MHLLDLAIFLLYFLFVIGIIIFSYHKQKSDTDFVIGNRSLNYWLTALSAHASDMSNWLFMGYPALIFTTGIFNSWAAVGLTLFMFLNWHFIAPKIRVATEKTNSLTLSNYFEKRFSDTSGAIRIVSSLLLVLFFIIYISAGLQGLGFLAHSLFGLPYLVGITLGLILIVFYVFLGGYITVAWLDLFQGLFLLSVILFIPIFLLFQLGGVVPIWHALEQKNLSTSLFPDFSGKTIAQIFLIASGWGLGYFGQPHILTKFMGIKKVEEMKKAKYLGISWQALTLGAATLIGLIATVFFPQGLKNPELVTLEIVKTTLFPFFAGLVLCAIFAATTNVVAAQILVSASSLSEDCYRQFHKEASHSQLLKISRLSVLFVAALAYIVACFKITTIYELVLYSWSGIGSSFGPLLLLSLYTKKINRKGALAGILTGGFISALWPYLRPSFAIDIPPMIPAFIFSFCVIILISRFPSPKNSSLNIKLL